MTEVTVNAWIETGLPSVEVANITPAADGNTYSARKFKKVKAAFVSFYDANAGAADCVGVASIADNVVTLQIAGTARQCFIMCIG